MILLSKASTVSGILLERLCFFHLLEDCVFFWLLQADKAFCDFETDFCDYNKNFRFERWTGKAPVSQFAPFSGPLADHTTGTTGFYALCRGSTLTSDTAECQLNKTFTNANQHLDYTFWYYFYGATVGSLELFVNGELIWYERTSVKAWRKGQVKFPVGEFTVNMLGFEIIAKIGERSGN